MVTVNSAKVELALDMCSEASMASSSLWRQLSHTKLLSPPKILAYRVAEVSALGQFLEDVGYAGYNKKQPLVFVESPRVLPLFRVPWIDTYYAVRVNNIDADDRLAALLKKFEDVFEQSSGSIKGYFAHQQFKPSAAFKINKASPVPFSYRPFVEEELERFVQQGVLTNVDVAVFTNKPLVVAPKPNGRVCVRKLQGFGEPALKLAAVTNAHVLRNF